MENLQNKTGNAELILQSWQTVVWARKIWAWWWKILSLNLHFGICQLLCLFSVKQRRHIMKSVHQVTWGCVFRKNWWKYNFAAETWIWTSISMFACETANWNFETTEWHSTSKTTGNKSNDIWTCPFNCITNDKEFWKRGAVGWSDRSSSF